MEFVQLQHHACLGMPKGKHLLKLSQSVINECNRSSCDYLITFRLLPQQIREKRVHNIHACVRMNGLYDGDISFYALETDSPFAPLILWDIAHTLSIGRILRFYGDHVKQYTLCKEYYQSAFRTIETGSDYVAFQKITVLPVETERGLDDWTFGIPTGPGDATILNAAVKRILEIPCRNKEIILCGRPGENFKYWDQVKIVGEDISAPPVQIAKKKNCIAKHASHGNLCILHDRVFLPSDFMDAMRKYGDDYSITTLQSVYFDDYHNFNPYRYSDMNTLDKNEVSGGICGINEISSALHMPESYAFNPNLLDITERANGFYYQNPLRTSLYTYATGSLYITKKSVWNSFPQDEQLKWENFEDVAWGYDCSQHGIPHRINPWTISQSILARVIILPETGITYFNSAGKKFRFLPMSAALQVKHKPLLRCTESTAWEKILLFKNRYCPDASIVVQSLTSEYRFQVILQLLNAAQFELDEDNIDRFLHDVETLLLLATLSHRFKQYMKEHFLIFGGGAMVDILNNQDFRRQLELRLHETPFMKELTDYGVENRAGLRLGSFFSACLFAHKNKQFLFHPEGLKGFYRSILNSTPYKSYF